MKERVLCWNELPKLYSVVSILYLRKIFTIPYDYQYLLIITIDDLKLNKFVVALFCTFSGALFGYLLGHLYKYMPSCNLSSEKMTIDANAYCDSILSVAS